MCTTEGYLRGSLQNPFISPVVVKFSSWLWDSHVRRIGLNAYEYGDVADRWQMVIITEHGVPVSFA